MNILNKICNFIEEISTIKSEYVYLVFISLLIILIANIIRQIVLRLSLKKDLNSREKYMYNKKGHAIFSIIVFVLLFLVWSDYLKSFMTIITFISTAITLSIKDIVFNWVYIYEQVKYFL